MTQLTVTDAFDLPRPQDIRAMGFVIKLREASPDSDEVRRLVDDYVVTPVVAAELPRILGDMKQICDRGEEYGRFIHGSFGSGKSHLMTMLGLLLEHKGRDPAKAGRDPRWSEGLKRMAEHARAQGFGGVVLLIDEFLLWLAEKSGQEFIAESIERMAEDPESGLDAERRRALDQLVKTVLLGEVSPRLRGTGGLTQERLVQLHSADVEGETFRGRLLTAKTDLLALSQRARPAQAAGAPDAARPPGGAGRGRGRRGRRRRPSLGALGGQRAPGAAGADDDGQLQGVSEFQGGVRRALEGLGEGTVRVALVRRR